MGRALARPMDPALFTEADRRRFWTKVDVHGPGGCWLWTAGCNAKGYGRIGWAGSARFAHRWSYVLHKGAIAGDLVIDHLCRVPACVNPEHLEPVPHPTNIQRGVPRTVAACPQGHPYTPENTSSYMGKDGYLRRTCRTCKRERLRERAATPEAKAKARAYREANRDRRRAYEQEPENLARHREHDAAYRARATPEQREAARARNRAYRARLRAAQEKD